MPYVNTADKIVRQRERRREQRAERERLSTRSSGATAAPATPAATSPPARRPATPSTQRYWREREAGRSETEALAALRHDRARQQQEKQVAETDRRVAVLAPQFLAAARRHLAGAGSYVEADVMPLARHMAARSVVLEQPARQGDRMEQLPPPRLPALPPPQVAQPIWPGSYTSAGGLGYHPVKLGRRAALGSERRVLPEEAHQAIVDAVASLARRGKL